MPPPHQKVHPLADLALILLPLVYSNVVALRKIIYLANNQRKVVVFGGEEHTYVGIIRNF